MADDRTAALDDAPPSTSKRLDGEDAATAALIEPSHGAILGRAVTINRPVGELYAYWRDFSNLATFMENVERIDVLDPKRSHWVVKAPAGQTVEWDATVTEEQNGKLIAWASDAGAGVANSGRIEFADAGARGTVVTATISYDPAGIVGKIVAKMFQREPAIQARRDLRRFKQLMETGELATNARNPAMRDEDKD
ncbi:MAG: SRPBCC family protein [Sphingomonadaceae bacterium]|nr:SRPBCC family protein [Sphingomonadaceae bacterium]